MAIATTGLLLVLLVLELRLASAIRLVGEQVRSTETQVSEYRTFTKYLPRKERDAHTEKLGSTFRSLRFLHMYRFFLGKRRKTLVETYYTRAEELRLFLEQFILEYMKGEVERNKDFFEGRSFDRDQIEAIVKRDTHNLVIASAGSGKTRTLTARVAFAVKRGTNPEEILALAYTNSAEREMRGRLRSDYGILNANVSTFHSFGRKLAKLSPKFRTDVADSADQLRLVKEAYDRLRFDRKFALLLLDFALESRTHKPADEKNFVTVEKYYEYLRNQKYITLDGKHVKSIAERDIANFLFLNRVKFEYEAPATWADRNEEYRQYRPDFFLPEYGLWIEHWAIDKQGNVPAWFSPGRVGNASKKYGQDMRWKRDQFKRHGRKLIETYNSQWTEGTLIPEVRRQLEKNLIKLGELTMKEILDRVQKLIPRRDPLDELMFSFISKAKTNGLSISDVSSRLANGNWSRKQRAFATMMIRIWQEYETLLERNDMIDFNDMINYALQVATQQDGQVTRQFSHILIDEFQDITDPQLALVECLLSNGKNNTLFCVGDDMQNIFTFAGSNVYNIVHFGKRFPHAEQTVLSTNYRCPKNIVDASNSVANMNRVKTEKQVFAASRIRNPICLIEMLSGELREYEAWEFNKARELLKQLLDSKKPGEQIMVLARFNRPVKRLELEFPHHESPEVRFLSIHGAKGTEADYVLLLGCISGRYGFPTEMMDQRVLDIVKKSQDDETDKLEEERRLFYVALTRCKKQLFVFTSRKTRSQFVSEVEPYLVTESTLTPQIQ